MRVILDWDSGSGIDSNVDFPQLFLDEAFDSLVERQLPNSASHRTTCLALLKKGPTASQYPLDLAMPRLHLVSL